MKPIHDRKDLKEVERVVVKIGTKSLTGKSGGLDPGKVAKFVNDVMEIRRKGKEVLIVTSGAIGAGMGRLGIKERPRRLAALQAVAAVGQSLLMRVYDRCFARWKQPVAQMLLSSEDFTGVRYGNFKNTLATLLSWGVIPVINENDTVATEEIRVGDNDLLSAYVAKGAKADLLVILSDVDRVQIPKAGRTEKLSVVERVSPQLERWAFRTSKKFGGMFTKIQAARMASESGIAVVIANSARRSILKELLEGKDVGTLFLPRVD